MPHSRISDIRVSAPLCHLRIITTEHMQIYQFTAYPGVCHTRPVPQCARVHLFKKNRQRTQVRLCHPLITSAKHCRHTVEQLIPEYAVPRRLSASTQLIYAAPWSWPLHPVRLTRPPYLSASAAAHAWLCSFDLAPTSVLQYFSISARWQSRHNAVASPSSCRHVTAGLAALAPAIKNATSLACAYSHRFQTDWCGGTVCLGERYMPPNAAHG